MWDKIARNRGLVVSLAAFALLLALGVSIAAGMNQANESSQVDLIRENAYRAAATCYAIEGRYPASVAYMSEHYGFTYDADSYIVVYDAFASNVMPDIRVIRKGETFR